VQELSVRGGGLRLAHAVSTGVFRGLARLWRPVRSSPERRPHTASDIIPRVMGTKSVRRFALALAFLCPGVSPAVVAAPSMPTGGLGVGEAGRPTEREDVAPVLQADTVWRLDKTEAVADHATKVLGQPQVVDGTQGKAVRFDGTRDGLFVPVNPIAGWDTFTIEVLFKPEAGGLAEQRFFHIQDEREARVLMETRLTPEGQWALDTFLMDGEHRLPLLDRTLLHPAGVWAWVALRYDGKRMTSFVNGQKELEGSVVFASMKPGRTSLGVRQNEVFWFKGSIAEVRFHPIALEAGSLQRPTDLSLAPGPASPSGRSSSDR